MESPWQFWDQRIRELQAYKIKNGDCNVPKGFENKQLASWVKEVRRSWRKGSSALTVARIEQLDALGFTWSKQTSQQIWETKIPELERYILEHGTSNVPQSEGSLGNWIARQRRLKSDGKLTGDQIAKLEELGMIWNLHDAAWEEQADRLRAHYAAGATWASMDASLKGWVSKQQREKRSLDAGSKTTMTAPRVAALERIGLSWEEEDQTQHK